MTASEDVSFAKMHGTGNDFLVLDNRAYQFTDQELSDVATAWCRRRYGIGADGLLALDHPRTLAADYRMHYVNADGSRATMCGNGARCLFRFAQRVGFNKAELSFNTDAGLYRATYIDEDQRQIRLFVPEVSDIRSDLVLEQAVPNEIDALHYVHAGTEHLVAIVGDVETVPVRKWGRQLRHDPTLEPTGANVNFVAANGTDTVSLRTYEKGVEDETLSCGTGVLAAAVIVEQTRRTPALGPVQVHTKGGRLSVGIAETERGPERYLEGPAVLVYQGTIDRPAPE